MKRVTLDEFLLRSNSVHNFKYKYHNVVFINTKVKVNIWCLKHKDFEQTPEKHMAGQGCPICRLENLKEKMLKVCEKNKKINIDFNWLHQKYIIENLSQVEIANILGVKVSSLNSYINKSFAIKKNKNLIRIKREETNISRYGYKTPAQSLIIKNKLNEDGKLILIINKTPNEWAQIYNIPPTPIYKWIENNEKFLDIDFLKFCKKYSRASTDIENVVTKMIGIPKWNKKVNSKINYRPDFKLSETIYLNVDGLYWHSELHKDKKYHFDMRKHYFNENNRILQFRSDEIFNKFNIVKSMIFNVLNKTSFKLGARKTNVKNVNSNDAKLFLKNNHIKGYKNAKHIGLYCENELVSLMSYKLGKGKTFIKIERFCSKINYNIIGAFSKLLKYVTLNMPKLPIHYWVDLRYGTGEFLIKQGFKLEKETLGWEWTDFKQTYNRLKCRANMDERKLKERDYAREYKLFKIYDAGQRLFIK